MYDPKDKKTDRREALPFITKYWPIVAVLLGFSGSTLTFYVNSQEVAADVNVIKESMDTFASGNIVDLQFRIVENRIESMEKEYEGDQDRTEEQFIKVEKKLDQIYDFMLKQAGESQQ